MFRQQKAIAAIIEAKKNELFFLLTHTSKDELPPGILVTIYTHKREYIFFFPLNIKALDMSRALFYGLRRLALIAMFAIHDRFTIWRIARFECFRTFSVAVSV